MFRIKTENRSVSDQIVDAKSRSLRKSHTLLRSILARAVEKKKDVIAKRQAAWDSYQSAVDRAESNVKEATKALQDSAAKTAAFVASIEQVILCSCEFHELYFD